MVTLGKGPFNAYIRDAAVPQWLNERTYNQLLDGLPPARQVRLGVPFATNNLKETLLLYLLKAEGNELECWTVPYGDRKKGFYKIRWKVTLPGVLDRDSLRLAGNDVVLEAGNFRLMIHLTTGMTKKEPLN